MPSDTSVTVACLALRVLRDPALAARHRILTFLVDLPHDLGTLTRSPVEFLIGLSNVCELSLQERTGIATTMLGTLGMLSKGVESAMDMLVSMKGALMQPLQAATKHGQAEVNDYVPATGQLVPGITHVSATSSLGLLLRRLVVEVDSGMFDGLKGLCDAGAAALHDIKVWTGLGMPMTGVPPQLQHRQAADPTSRDTYIHALLSGDINTALHALHSHFDTGYGTMLLGGSATHGSTTPLAILTGDGTSSVRLLNDGSSAVARVQELLVSSSTAPPAGGAAMGRSLLHYALLAHASLHASVGAWEEAADALAECTRVAQASGDAPAAAYALLLSGEVKQGRASGRAGSDVSTPLELDPEAADLMRRARHRAGELGLWRQQVQCSLLLVEGTVVAAAQGSDGPEQARADTRTDAACPLTMPDWLSLDPFTSMRPGGYACGAPPASVGGGVGGAAAVGGAGAGPSPTVTLAASGPGRDGLGAALLTAITSPTVASAVAVSRRHRALNDRRPSLGGSNPSAFAASDAAGSGRMDQGPASIWSVPLPLSWQETVALQQAGHLSRARMWTAMGSSADGPGPLPPVAALLLADAAEACAQAASIPTSTTNTSAAASAGRFDLDALLDACGCEPAAKGQPVVAA